MINFIFFFLFILRISELLFYPVEWFKNNSFWSQFLLADVRVSGQSIVFFFSSFFLLVTISPLVTDSLVMVMTEEGGLAKFMVLLYYQCSYFLSHNRGLWRTTSCECFNTDPTIKVHWSRFWLVDTYYWLLCLKLFHSAWGCSYLLLLTLSNGAWELHIVLIPYQTRNLSAFSHQKWNF